MGGWGGGGVARCSSTINTVDPHKNLNYLDSFSGKCMFTLLKNDLSSHTTRAGQLVHCTLVVDDVIERISCCHSFCDIFYFLNFYHSMSPSFNINLFGFTYCFCCA